MTRFWAICGAANACLSVMAGAFGAHALRSRLSPELLAIFETAARYQMYHALGLIAVALAINQGRLGNAAGWLMLVGIVLFSGSLYGLALSGIRQLGAITPLGGLCFIAAWTVFAWSYLRR
jgi:uncharacterized membrane protein YgdD (TMEM256/DUF423 family)